MNEMLRAEGAAGVGDLPCPGAAILLRFSCCVVDLPARVLDVQDARVTISAPIHLCRRPEIGARCSATWDCKTGVARASGTVESQRPRPPTWLLALDSAIERIDVEQRHPDDSPGILDIGTARLPARVVDRSFNGVACVVPALANLRPGLRVRVMVGRYERAGTIARVRSFGNQLRVGIRLDELVDSDKR